MQALSRSSIILTVSAAIIAACTTGPVRKELNFEEQVRLDIELADPLVRDFERKLAFIPQQREVEVSIYLREVAVRLADQRQDLKVRPTGLFLVDDRVISVGGPTEKKWRNYAWPGNRVYLSVGLLKSVSLESEAAAALAMELAHIGERSLIQRVEAMTSTGTASGMSSSIDFFSSAGAFSFTDSTHIDAIEHAVLLMYGAGYDPRGLVALWKKYQENLQQSPYTKELLDRLTERTREVIAELAPLRNPIVRTEAFANLKKRIEKL